MIDEEESTPIEVLPSGEVRSLGESSRDLPVQSKPLTMRENLGGEYARNLERIRREIKCIKNYFDHVNIDYPSDGNPIVSVILIPNQKLTKGYVVDAVLPQQYPNKMPEMYIKKPTLIASCPHRWSDKKICYLHPNEWNPGKHDLTFAFFRAAKWLAKYQIFKQTKKWPGVEDEGGN